MSVCFPFSRTSDWALFDSSGRTKFSDNVQLTNFNPAFIATGSSVAQYFPSKYSSTKTGTFAPTFTLRTRSLRTTFPAKMEDTFWSSSGILGYLFESFSDQFTTAFQECLKIIG